MAAGENCLIRLPGLTDKPQLSRLSANSSKVLLPPDEKMTRTTVLVYLSLEMSCSFSKSMSAF